MIEIGAGTKILFIDTNGFLQVRDLKDIPWKKLFPSANAVDVMVAPSIIAELDRHKVSGNQRRRDRARLALRQIDAASSALDRALVLREDPIRVRIVISTAPRVNWAEHAHLDPGKADDQLVAEALSFGRDAAVFSHDTGPRIRARIAGLEAYEPAEDWLLPAEQTDDQRTITKLQAELKRALVQFPSIVAGFGQFDKTTSEIHAIRPVLKPLDSELVDRFVVEYLGRNPCREVFSTTSPWGISSPLHDVTEHQVEEYYAEYASFEQNVRDYYSNLHERVRTMGAVVAINYWVRNDSGVAAHGLRVEFDLEGAGSLLADREEASPYVGSTLKMPQPPEPPRPYDYLANIPLREFSEPPRDPVAFYWFKRPEIVASHSARQCQEFRATRVFTDTLLVLTPDDLPAEFGIRLHVEAGNLSTPVNISAKVVVTEEAVEWSDPIIKEIFPADVFETLAEHLRGP
ncbi:PIN domain-containing protein [Bradyrhizobium liaoningense]|uniref:PIN domain-containing protein n=1 Tax=Bradyrhizobium liaoningense TaxID=43992 RepID=UPI001BAC363E|nr:PIN domain-containing protein [Bradyrhizobium liaoningense]MBR0705408.1 hypothetical protein [Bradyrhizobium liaoningense]